MKAITPPQLAKQLGVKADKVVSWIRTGQLTAVNVAESPTGRPRWRIMPEAVDEFLRSRESVKPAPPARRRRRRPLIVKQYF